MISVQVSSRRHRCVFLGSTFYIAHSARVVESSIEPQIKVYLPSGIIVTVKTLITSCRRSTRPDCKIVSVDLQPMVGQERENVTSPTDCSHRRIYLESPSSTPI